jgi:hypothetical protein
VSAAHVQKGNTERPWTTVYLGGRVIPKARVEMRHDRFQSRENQSVTLWHPVIETRRVSEYESIKQGGQGQTAASSGLV